MNISEQQAKEVLDFLVYKINPEARWTIDAASGFVLDMSKEIKNTYRLLDDPYLLYVAFGNEITNISRYFRKNMTCLDMLKMLLNCSSGQPIYAISVYNASIYVFMQKGTTLEQIFIDMDLSANV